MKQPISLILLLLSTAIFIDCDLNNQKSTCFVPSDFTTDDTNRSVTLLKILEAQYLLKYKSINNTLHWLEYISNQTACSEHSEKIIVDFITSYLKNPSQWPKHQQLHSEYTIRKTHEFYRKNYRSQEHEKQISKAIANYYIGSQANKSSTLPKIKLKFQDKSNVNLSEICSNKTTIIYFWATWCAPCKILDKDWDRIVNNNTNTNLSFVKISIDKEQPKPIMNVTGSDSKVKTYWISPTELEKLKTRIDISAIPKFVAVNDNLKVLAQNLPKPDSKIFYYIIENS